MSRIILRLPVALALGAVLATAVPAAMAAGSRGGRPSGGPAAMSPRGGGSMAPGARTARPGAGPSVARPVIVAPIDIDRFFWGPAFGFGFGWGWPYYAAGGWYGPPYPYGYTRTVPGDWAAVELHVHPRKALVRIDGYDAGEARNFNSAYEPLWLKPGAHTLELSYPGYMTLRVRLAAAEGGYLKLRYSLEEGEGLDPRSVKRTRGAARSRPEPRSQQEPESQPGD